MLSPLIFLPSIYDVFLLTREKRDIGEKRESNWQMEDLLFVLSLYVSLGNNVVTIIDFPFYFKDFSFMLSQLNLFRKLNSSQ